MMFRSESSLLRILRSSKKTCIRDLGVFEPPETFHNVNLPEKYRLPVMPKVPSIFGVIKPPKTSRELHKMMGEETYSNKLILNQFGVVAIHGGVLKSNHFEMIRNTVGHHIKKKKAFAIYRVDAPHKSVSRMGMGKRMGGGKASIDHYSTPIRAGRVILEVGGPIQWEQVYYWLKIVAERLPFEAIPVTGKILERLDAEEKRLEGLNTNPYSFEWLIRNNIMDCQRHFSPYDKKLFGKFVYKDKTLNKKWNETRQSKYIHRN